MSQRYDVLRLLRAAGPVGVHTFELRAAYFGNPSQRVAELEAEGHVITHTRERLRGSAVGTRYVLVRDAASGAQVEQPRAGRPAAEAFALDVPSTPQCAIFEEDWAA